MTIPMDIGALNQRVVIETQQPATFDAAGARLAAPLVQHTYPAAVSFKRFSADTQDARRTQTEEITVTLRWQTRITRDAVVIWRTERYRIATVEQSDTQRLWMTLNCIRDV
ncbi:MAG: head-tail adaptor protein [Pseudomonadota bacterium]